MEGDPVTRRLRSILPIKAPRSSVFGTGYRRYKHTPAPLPTAHTPSSLKDMRESYAASLTPEQRAAWVMRHA